MSLPSPNPNKDRRQYFRIRHSLLMSYEKIDVSDKTLPTKDNQTDSSPSMQLLKEINKLELQNQSFISSLQAEQEAVSTYIENLNDKLSSLSHYIINNLDFEYKELFQVDLSGGGIRFESETELDVGQQIKMELILLPEYSNILTYGKVVDCHILAEKQSFELAVSFSEIHESDRDAIIKHVFEEQSKQLRSDKDKQNTINKKNEN